MINKELRNIGSLIRLFSFKPSIDKYYQIWKREIKRYKGKNLAKKHLNMKEIIIDGVRVCVYEPKVKKDNAVGLLWLHGGGFISGLPEMEANYIKKFVIATKCVVFAPDYTKAHIKPYPAALLEVNKVLLYMKENTKKYDINNEQLFVAGISAGGGLTAALSLYARDQGLVNIAFQMPLYPMLDDRSTKYNSNNDAPMWNGESNVMAWQYYLRGLDEVPKYGAPARETNYSNLPPTLSFVGSIDPFYMETKTYIKNLNKANVETTFKVYDGAYHAFERVAFWKKISKSAIKFSLDGFISATQKHYKKQNI